MSREDAFFLGIGILGMLGAAAFFYGLYRHSRRMAACDHRINIFPKG